MLLAIFLSRTKHPFHPINASPATNILWQLEGCWAMATIPQRGKELIIQILWELFLL